MNDKTWLCAATLLESNETCELRAGHSGLHHYPIRARAQFDEAKAPRADAGKGCVTAPRAERIANSIDFYKNLIILLDSCTPSRLFDNLSSLAFSVSDIPEGPVRSKWKKIERNLADTAVAFEIEEDNQPNLLLEAARAKLVQLAHSDCPGWILTKIPVSRHYNEYELPEPDREELLPCSVCNEPTYPKPRPK